MDLQECFGHDDQVGRACGGVLAFYRASSDRRLFHLKLRPDTSAFHKDLVVETAQLGRITPDISHIYSGELVGEPSSLVYGSLVDGVFHGAIQSPWGRYYVENARRFFPRPKAFHSVLYDARDAHFPDTGAPGGWCGLRADTERWMDAVMKSRATLAAEQGIRRKVSWPSGLSGDNGTQNRGRGRNNSETRNRSTSRFAGAGTRSHAGRVAGHGDLELSTTVTTILPDSGERSGSGDEEALNASARIAVPSTSRRVCNLKLSIDHLLYGHMHDQESNPHRTRARITAFIAAHVTRASAVFQRTTFGNIQDITFIVQKIRINDSQSCAEGVKKNNPFCSDGIDASYLLHLTSKENNDDFCLAYTWTFRDFADGILGLAWIARPQRLCFALRYSSVTVVSAAVGQGGICEKNRPSVDLKPGTTEYRQYHLSLNTGIVTFLNYNNPVSQSVSEITFCHEMGHNFGSPPDLTPCNEGTQVCMKGECSSSICMKYGLKECTLTGSRYSVDELCLIACQESGQCLPACDFPKMKAHCGAKLTPGAPCNGLRGYCDVFRKCRDVDAEGPLTRLQRIFFGERSVNKIKDFIMVRESASRRRDISWCGSSESSLMLL
ncbi:hypothetical protein V5799_033008 [Amblyomma americanum]|uniref:Peptidase M12B domain-containing protein n=1 Tax=Amblyomma americanum TaxID=6943 RepID=A0AAQ4DPI8_AMBAM